MKEQLFKDNYDIQLFKKLRKIFFYFLYRRLLPVSFTETDNSENIINKAKFYRKMINCCDFY